MTIDFQTITGNKQSQSVDNSGMEFRMSKGLTTGKTDSVGGASYVAQLDTSIFSNDAYAQHARTTDDVRDMAQNTDVWTQHNYMALLSNTMSEEDFARASQDGFDIKNIDSSETVTILDKIKSVLLESGVEISGFNDDLSIDKLAKITGSRSFAVALTDSFHKNDIPVTADSAREATVAYNEVSSIEKLDDNAAKYLIQNNMSPTIENLYLASHSTNGQNISGRGFYAQDAGGYYAKKADTFDWTQLQPQIDKIIEEAELEADHETVAEQAKWIVSQGIPLTKENLIQLNTLRAISFPITEEHGADAIAAAIVDSKKATDADLSDPRSTYQKAYEIKKDTENIDVDDIRTTIQEGKELNLNNLIKQSFINESDPLNVKECAVLPDDARVIEARIQLEEIRLRMTVDANRTLLASGFSIDTAPITELIERLRNLLGQFSDEGTGNMLDEIEEITSQNSSYLVSATISRVNIIKSGPIDISGAMLGEFERATLSSIAETSERLSAKYKQAGEEYESLMTRPRSDLGDSIKSAFRNVDDILKDLGYEATEDNKRAVRILGYNSMELSSENIEKVRAWDQMLKTTVERLKPGAVVDIIREGRNPLGMTVEELATSLDQGNTENGSEGGKSKSDEKYSKFLYKLEQNGEITDKERSAFIGIYRLFHNLKVNDYQAIGAVLKMGKSMTLGNLLKATRTQKKAIQGMDYSIDDSFGGIERKESFGESALKIDEQIGMAFRFYSAKADIVYENLEPDKLMNAKPDEATLLEQLADKLQNQETDQELEKEYNVQQLRHIRETASMREVDPALEELKATEIETTFNNLEAMISNRRSRRTEGLWKKAGEAVREGFDKEQKLLVDALDEDDYEDVYKNTLGTISEKMQEVLENEAESYIDVRAISLMQKQLSVMSQSSERGTFDVPVEIDGQKISMHITLKSDNSVDSRMEASIMTYEFGLISATLYKRNGAISGMLTTTNGQSNEEAEYLEGVRSKMCVKLAEKLKDVGVGQDNIAILYHAQTQPTSVGQTNANATDGNTKNITDTRELLTMAKAFIEAL